VPCRAANGGNGAVEAIREVNIPGGFHPLSKESTIYICEYLVASISKPLHLISEDQAGRNARNMSMYNEKEKERRLRASEMFLSSAGLRPQSSRYFHCNVDQSTLENNE